MKSKTTAIWFVLAALLAAGIWVYQTYLQPAAPVVATLLPGLRATEVTGIQVSPADAAEISVVRTNGAWLLLKPLVYPAQAAAIEALASTLEKMVPALPLAAADLPAKTNADKEFGFEKPQFSVFIDAGDQRRQVLVGNRTAPGDQVYIRVVGLGGVFVTDANWLQLLPRLANDWRDTSLVDAAAACDWIVITNGTKVIEFRRNATNQLWRMIRPLDARADGARLATAWQQLRSGHVTQFLPDDPRTDLSSYGLQPAELDVWLGQGTNLTAGVQAGKNLPENSPLVYARRAGWNTVVTASKDAFAGWRGAVNDYRDPHLLTLTTPVAEIEVRGESPFTLTLHGSNDWAIAGEKFPADRENVQAFLKMLADIRVSEFVKDVATETNLQDFGLVSPTHQIILRAVPGDTNSVLDQLLFGVTDTNRVFTKRADEKKFVYAITPADFNNLFLFNAGWYFRDRRVWNFAETNVVQVTLHQNGQTRQLIRTGEDKWSFGSGSQGIISPKDVTESVRRLGQLTAAGWVGRNVTEPEKFGLNTNNLALTVELKSGEKFNLDLGLELPTSQTALAAVTLEGQRWAFVMDPTMFQFVATFLTIPPKTL